MKPKEIAAMGGLVTCTMAGLLFALPTPRPPDPTHAGRRVSVWYGDLCTGVFVGTGRASGWAVSYAAFTNMPSEAVPFLVDQLLYDRSGIRQKLIAYSRRFTVTGRLTANIIWPPECRNYAAVALRQMGPRAESAIPALLEAWVHDGPEMRVNAVSALESILRGHTTGGTMQDEQQMLESSVISEASRRYPAVAKELGISPEALE